MRSKSFSTIGARLMRGVGIGFLLLCSMSVSVHAAESEEAISISIQPPSSAVGTQSDIVIEIEALDGFKITQSYRNRIMELSAFEDAVDFERKLVLGTISDDGKLSFRVGVTPKRVGANMINGIMRVSFHDGERVDFRSIPLKVEVTGTE